MKKFLAIINYRTLIAITIALVMLYLSYTYDISYNVDLTLLSIAIIFPLVFNIRMSFRRREKAMDHLSQFRSSLKTIEYFFTSSTKLTLEDKQEISGILQEISDKTLDHLSKSDYNTKELDETVQKIFEFIVTKDTLIPRTLKDKLLGCINDLHDSIDNLHGIHVHRTPISLKAYCEYFIYAFPVVYVPAMIFHTGLDSSKWITIIIVIFSEFILITLFNIQDHLEYPFDDNGLDDIRLEIFKLNR